MMLDAFYRFVESHIKHKWVHWNMRDVNYGFQAIAHRYGVLLGEPIEIPEENLINLADLLPDIYGENYIGHRHPEQLTNKNQITRKDFLTGGQEADAFENKEYVKLHQSTLRKVDVIAKIAERANYGTLKTDAKLRDIYGGYGPAAAEFVKENWVAVIAFAVIGVLGTAVTVLQLFR